MSMEMLDRVFQERRKAQEELRSFYQDIDTNDMTAEQTEKESRLASAITDLQTREQRLFDIVKADRELDEMRANVPDPVTTIVDEKPVSERRQLDGFLRGDSTGNTDRGASFTIEHRDAVDLTAGTATDGAELVPETMYGSIWNLITHESPIMMAGPTVIRTSGGEKITVPHVTSNSAAALVTEAAAIGEDAPQFAQAELDAYKYGFLIKVTSELLADSAFNVVDFVTSHGASALGRGVNTAFVTGSGSSQPQGVDLATVGKQIAASAAPTAAELIDLVHSVSPPARTNAVWLLHDTVIASIRKIDVATNNIWQPGLAAGQPDRLLGAPVYADPNLSSGGSNAIIGVYGDMRGFYTRFAGGFRIERSDDFAFDTDHSTFRFLARVDSVIVDTVGIRTLQDPV